MIGDRELCRLRGEHYALLSRLFLTEPTEDLLEALGKDLLARARGAAQRDMALAQGWRNLRGLFEDGEPSAWVGRCDEEFLRLFVGPGVPETTPCESYYLTGKIYAEPLAWVRDFMKEAGLERATEMSEAEDHIAFELEIMRHLISKQEQVLDSDGETRWLGLQGTFYRRHLAAWAPAFFQDLEGRQETPFYGAIGTVGKGFLAWEGRNLEPWGPSAEEAAPRPALSKGEWKGPLIDLSPPEDPPEILGEKGE